MSFKITRDLLTEEDPSGGTKMKPYRLQIAFGDDTLRTIDVIAPNRDAARARALDHALDMLTIEDADYEDIEIDDQLEAHVSDHYKYTFEYFV